MPLLQILGLVLFWLVLIGLFLALYTYLGMLAYGWYKKRKKARDETPKTE